MKKIFIALLTAILLIGTTACSSSSNTEEVTTTTAETIEENTNVSETSIENYKNKVYSLTETIEEASVLLSNMAKYEYNYMSSLYKISGRMDSDSVVENGRTWLSEKGNVKEDRIDKDFEKITNDYFEIKELTVSGKKAETIDEKLSNLYDEYSAFYTQTTTASSLDNFADDYNDHVNAITEHQLNQRNNYARKKRNTFTKILRSI